jgi:two-component sensor histidine kinase
LENSILKAENTHLTQMLKQAGLDAQARDVADRIQGMVIGEIHHRMKNMLTMVTAIVRQSMRSAASLDDAQVAIDLRLQAMARAHDLLLKADWKSTSLRDLVQGAVQQHDTVQGRIAITGTDIQIVASAIQPLILALNELCTNAIKYGALSNDAGHVAIGWTTAADMLSLRWVESGGPAVAPPARKSFGMRLIADALPRQLGATARLDFAPPGLIFELVVPLHRLAPAQDDPQKEIAHG